MPGKLFFVVLGLIFGYCLSQEGITKPTFSDVFQTEVEGTFKTETGVVEIDASLYFDRQNNRAALFITKEGSLMSQVYNFDNGESIAIDGNDCDVQKITDESIFFPFTILNGKKIMSPAEEVLYFKDSELDWESVRESDLPELIYKTNVDLPLYGKKNCDVKHTFSKPDMELATCREGSYCNATLMYITVRCKNEGGNVEVDHVYKFFRFRNGIQDESVFLPPPGIHCEMKNTLMIPPLTSYFSFSFDIIEKTVDGTSSPAVFNTHKQVWYEADYRVVRIDEFDFSGLLYSSRIFDLKAGVAFTIITSVPTCDVGPVTGNVDLSEITRLPKAFFTRNNATEKAVYVGKRKVHGLDYEVWSLMWTDAESEARIVEEIYYLQIDPNKDLTPDATKKEPYSQISHVDMYTYEINDNSQEYDLYLLKFFSINNYRTKPSEWSAFDVSTCFRHTQKKEFAIKIETMPLIKGSQSDREVIELLYNKIISATGISVVRINELSGVFDGVNLVEVRGSILDNSKSTGWPGSSKEPGMDESLQSMVKAASENKLSVTFKAEDGKERVLKVTSVEAVKVPAGATNSCYSGASLAAAGLVLLLMGIAFGIAGYYVFLKKRRLSNNATIRMSDITNPE